MDNQQKGKQEASHDSLRGLWPPPDLHTSSSRQAGGVCVRSKLSQETPRHHVYRQHSQKSSNTQLCIPMLSVHRLYLIIVPVLLILLKVCKRFKRLFCHLLFRIKSWKHWASQYQPDQTSLPPPYFNRFPPCTKKYRRGLGSQEE